jgi:hypothetical protein
MAVYTTGIGNNIYTTEASFTSEARHLVTMVEALV